MNWQAAFTQIFEDKDWPKKLLFAGVMSLIPIVNIIPIGYALRVLKNVADGSDHPFPSWDDLGGYFVQGLTSLIGVAVWSLPILAVAMLTWVLSIWTGYDYADTARTSAPFMICLWSMTCLSGLYILFLAAVLPAALTWYAVKGQLGAMFRIEEILRFVSHNLGVYLGAVFLSVVAAFVSQIGLVFCCIGVVLCEYWATLVSSHLFGQVYRLGTIQAAPLELAD